MVLVAWIKMIAVELLERKRDICLQVRRMAHVVTRKGGRQSLEPRMSSGTLGD